MAAPRKTEAPITCTADRQTREVGNFAPALPGKFDPAFTRRPERLRPQHPQGSGPPPGLVCLDYRRPMHARNPAKPQLSGPRCSLKALFRANDVSKWDQPNVMPQFADLAPPKVGAAACFHSNNARQQLAEELQHLHSPQLLAQHCAARAIRPMDLKYILR